MSKIQNAIDKARNSQLGHASRVVRSTSGHVAKGDRSPGPDQSGLFVSLEGRGRHLPIDEDIAEESRILCSSSNEQAIASYKILRTRVLQRMRSNRWNKLAVTSCGPGEGKTLTSINLAISLAKQENQNVILVDLDFVHPTICRYLGIQPRVGLAEYFSGNATVDDILIAPNIDRLLLLASDNPIDNSSETLRSNKMLELLDIVASKNSSSIIIFDLPPLLRSDDVLAFGPLVDAILFVVSTGRTSRADIEKAKELLNEFEVLGTALNMSDESAPAYT